MTTPTSDAHRETLLRNMAQADLLGFVVANATFEGWFEWHDNDPRWNKAGLPEMLLLRPPEFIVVQVKTERAAVTKQQREMLRAFAASGIEAHVWRPSDRDKILARLSAPIPAHPPLATTVSLLAALNTMIGAER